MNAKLAELEARLMEVYDLRMVGNVLSWDQTTYMPRAGAEARGRQSALLSRLAHERFTDPEVGRLLDALEPWGAQQPHDSDAAALLRVTRRDYDLAVKVPTALVAEMNQHTSVSYEVWADA